MYFYTITQHNMKIHTWTTSLILCTYKLHTHSHISQIAIKPFHYGEFAVFIFFMIISIYRLSFNQYITLPLTRETRYNCDNFRRKNEINKYMRLQPCRPNLSLVHNKRLHNIQHKLQLLIRTGTTFYPNKIRPGRHGVPTKQHKHTVPWQMRTTAPPPPHPERDTVFDLCWNILHYGLYT